MLIVCVGAIFVCFAMVAICYRWSSQLTLVYAATKTTKTSFDWKRRDVFSSRRFTVFLFCRSLSWIDQFFVSFSNLDCTQHRCRSNQMAWRNFNFFPNTDYQLLVSTSYGIEVKLTWACHEPSKIGFWTLTVSPDLGLLKTSKYDNWASPSLWRDQL